MKISTTPNRGWEDFFSRLSQMLTEVPPPSAAMIVEEFGRDPFLVLASTIISLRTKDNVTLDSSRRLFALAKNIEEMSNLELSAIEEAIFPAGFYRNKAKSIREIAQRLKEEQRGVPSTLEGLLELPGVGLKTANLTLALGFQIPAICVDIHVHRIFNRLGLIQTESPDESEAALRQLIPPSFWISTNHWFVLFGQNICLPRGPKCRECLFQKECSFQQNSKSF